MDCLLVRWQVTNPPVHTTHFGTKVLYFSTIQLSKIKDLRPEIRLLQKKPDRKPQDGGGERDRTDDLLRARQALSQLSYTPILNGGPRWT